MADFEQKTDEYGTTILKLVRVKSSVVGNAKFYGNVMLVIKQYKENDLEMMTVRIVSISNQSNVTANMNNIVAAEKLSINKITALANHKSNSIDFGPGQGIFIEESLRGKGIGSFAMNELVIWIKSKFTEYAINPFEFILGDMISETDKKIRNDFFENFGFTISYSDHTQNGGIIKIKKAGMLKEHYNAEKIDEMNIEKYVFGLITDKYKIEKDYTDLKQTFDTRSNELVSGIPKADIAKYTLVCCVIAIFLLVILLN